MCEKHEMVVKGVTLIEKRGGCEGCFFENKTQCPDCAIEYHWVKKTYPWRTGLPKEDGEYLVIYQVDPEDENTRHRGLLEFKNGKWQKFKGVVAGLKIIAWWHEAIIDYEGE